MIVNVNPDRSVTLLEPEDTRGFKLVAPQALGDDDLARALVGVADLDAGHAWVHEAWIRQTSPLAASSDWQAAFGKMLDYARSKNWLRATDGAIRAHIERI